MANSRQSRKRARQATKRSQINASRRSAMRTFIKKAYSAINTKDSSAANSTARKLASVLDKLVNKGTVHKNKAARQKRRLNAHIKKLAA